MPRRSKRRQEQDNAIRRRDEAIRQTRMMAAQRVQLEAEHSRVVPSNSSFTILPMEVAITFVNKVMHELTRTPSLHHLNDWHKRNKYPNHESKWDDSSFTVGMKSWDMQLYQATALTTTLELTCHTFRVNRIAQDMRATVRRHQVIMRGVIQKRARFLIDESVHAGDGGYVEPTALFHIPGLRAALGPNEALCLDFDFAIRKSRWMSSAVFMEMMISRYFCSKRFLGNHGVNGEAFLKWVLQEKQR